jgi:hypothetical protein
VQAEYKEKYERLESRKKKLEAAADKSAANKSSAAND